MAKAKKKQMIGSPLRTEKTASRSTVDPPKRQLQIEKLGKVITWHIPTEAHKNDDNLRSAFIGGFEARAQQVNSDSDEGMPIRFPKDSKSQQAFADGYNAAATQDGRNLQPKALAGSVAEKPRDKKRR